MSDTLPTGEEEPAEIDAPEPEALASELGLQLTEEEREEAEKMVARLKEQFSLGEETEATPEPEPSEPEPEQPPEQEQPSEQPEQPVEAESGFVNIAGRLVPIEDARSMMELRQYLEANPDKAERVRAAIAEEPQPEPQPAEPEPPEFLDLEDPAQAFMWNQFKYQHAQINKLQAQQAQQQAEQAKSRANVEVQEGMNTFRTNHPELTEADIDVVRTHAVALNIIPGLEKVTGSGREAVLKALDLAYMDHPEFRAKATGTPSPKQVKAQESKERKQKLGGLAGSSSAAPRTPEPERRPESDREMREMAKKWLTEQNIL